MDILKGAYICKRSYYIWQDHHWEDRYRKAGILFSKLDVIGHTKMDQASLPNGKFSNGYESSWVRNIRKSIKVSLSLNKDIATFIDLGSGLGKACFVASENQVMNRIIGVEFDLGLHTFALDQMGKFATQRDKERIELLAEDASQYLLPDIPSIMYI